MPFGLYALNASKVILDKQSNLPSAIDLLEHIEIGAPPELEDGQIAIANLSKPFYVLNVVSLALDEEPGIFDCAMRIRGPNEKVQVANNIVKVDLTDAEVFRTTASVSALPIFGEGNYTFELIDTSSDETIISSSLIISYRES